MTLEEFLLARIAEDEAAAQADDVDWDEDDFEAQYALHGAQPHTLNCGWRLGESLSQECSCGIPARVLAECDARRRIVEEFTARDGDVELMLGNRGPTFDRRQREWSGLRLALRILAAMYADHPDYDEGWRP